MGKIKIFMKKAAKRVGKAIKKVAVRAAKSQKGKAVARAGRQYVRGVRDQIVDDASSAVLGAGARLTAAAGERAIHETRRGAAKLDDAAKKLSTKVGPPGFGDGYSRDHHVGIPRPGSGRPQFTTMTVRQRLM
jgi:hypothetical protein